jgi:hypothetical protein
MSYATLDAPSMQRRLRILSLVDAAEKALLAPLSMRMLHLMAYLSNVLAPVWDMPVLDGKLLKKGEGPFYPVLQGDADSLVGHGLLIQSQLEYVLNADKQWRLQGAYTLNHQLTDGILEQLRSFPEERAMDAFCTEVAYSLSVLASEQLHEFSTADATYADPQIDFGSVVDFAEWSKRNYATRAAEQLGELLPSGSTTTPGEKIHSYVRHLSRRLYARG